MAMLSQSAIARTWGPGCYHGPKIAVTLNGGGKVTVRAALGDAVAALDQVLRAHNYRTRPKDTGALVCRDKVGHPGEVSNHSYGTALDLNWQLNPYGTHRTDMSPALVRAVCAIRTRSGAQVWNWGGSWSTPDPMHFEIVCTPKDLASGIDPRTVPGAPPYVGASPTAVAIAPAPLAPIPIAPQEDDDMRLMQLNQPPGHAILVGAEGITKLSAESLANVWEPRLFKEMINARQYDLIVADAGHGDDPKFRR